MTWVWPLQGCVPLFPDAPGWFGTIRKHDVHTGIDLYCDIGSKVVAVEEGEVIRIEAFTGPNAEDPSPWWNDTQAVLVKGASGVVVYGEVKALVNVGDRVKQGQIIAEVETSVLRRFKGRPMVMLHFELLTEDATGTVWWRADEPRPEVLQNPARKLLDAADGMITAFSLDAYDGVRFRPTTNEE